MAIQISGTTVIDNSRNIQNVGIITASSFVGALTGSATSISTSTSNGFGSRTVQSGGSPTGGSDGDIYYIY
jgi:hypothetical protein